MLINDTSFRVDARRLKSPTSAAYDDELWQKAYESAADRTGADMNLRLAAIWIASQSQALRQSFPNPGFDALGPALAVVMAIAAINREFLTVDDKSSEMLARAEDEDGLAFGYLVGRPLPGGPFGQSGSSDDVIEAAVDAAESWLFDAYARPGSLATAPTDLAPLAVRAIQRYSIQHGLNDLWNQALWEGWRLASEDGDMVWLPGDRTDATRLEAARIRQHENTMNYPWLDATAWFAMDPEARRRRALPRTVIEVANSRGRRRIRVGRPSCRSRRPPPFLLDRAALEGSYLAPFLDRPFPKDPRMHCRLVLHAWHVILDMARALAKNLPRSTTLSEDEARAMALVVSRGELLSALMQALVVDERTADALIQLLSFKVKTAGEKGHRGLWSAPLVAVPGEDRYALALAALAVGYAPRKAEGWLEKGGVDDSLSHDARGDVYESHYRRDVRESLTLNPLLDDVRCAEHAIKRDADFGEEIDLLVQLGSILIVGEVKCWLFPADSHERYNHMGKLKLASKQARTKADLLRTRPDVTSRALGISEERAKQLRVVPLVITNQGFGFSLDVDGCRVTEAAYLKTYLGAGKIVTGMAVDPSSGRNILDETRVYGNEAEAVAGFDAAMSDPFVLRRFVERVEWKKNPFPAAGENRIFFYGPTLNDITGAERARAQAASRLLG